MAKFRQMDKKGIFPIFMKLREQTLPVKHNAVRSEITVEDNDGCAKIGLNCREIALTRRSQNGQTDPEF